MNQFYTEGWKAYYEGIPLKHNPYHHFESSLEDEGSWNTGWLDAKGADERAALRACAGVK